MMNATSRQWLHFTCDFDIEVEPGREIVLVNDQTRLEGRIPPSALALDTNALRRVIEDGLAHGRVIDADAPPRVKNVRIRWDLRPHSRKR